MNDDRPGPDTPAAKSGEHSRRVHEAFDDLDASLGDRATPEVRASVNKLRSAVLERDAARLRGQLSDVKARHGWLYGELTLHPRVAELVNELALMGL
jgi:hypothetical protein